MVVRTEGLYCVSGQFCIDPWRPVERVYVMADAAVFPLPANC